MHYRRKGMLSAIRGLSIDISYIEGFLSGPMYERRIRDAVAMLKSSLPTIRKLKLRMVSAQSTLSNDEIRFGSMAFDLLIDALPDLVSLDLSDCSISVLTSHAGRFSQLTRLQQIKWFSLGRNDMSSAAALHALVSANRHTLKTLCGKSDITDRVMQALCDAPNIQSIDASGANISDDALLTLIRARGSTMRELILSDCTRLTKRSIAQLTPKLLPKLASLDLYNVMVTTDTYQRLFNMNTFWPYLRDLKLKAAIPPTSPRQDSLVNDDILEAIGRRCPRLMSLRLFGCHGITDDGLSSILGNLGYLRELVVMHSASDPIVENEDEDDEYAGTGNREGGHVSGTFGESSYNGHTMQRDYSNDVDSDSGEAESSSSSGSSHVTAAANPPPPMIPPGGLLLNVPSISDIWATIPSLPSNALPSRNTHAAYAHRIVDTPQSTAPSSPCPSDQSRRSSRNQRVFTSQALRNGVRSKRFNLLNLDMEYDSVCAEHLSRLSHLHVLCGRMITRHAKSLIESQFPKCKMMVWNID
ncbi:RNI-like protein [Martensiomyces pterosporus]|nr:RNI-like protein [Martensiomyces pterosporus]